MELVKVDVDEAIGVALAGDHEPVDAAAPQGQLLLSESVEIGHPIVHQARGRVQTADGGNRARGVPVGHHDRRLGHGLEERFGIEEVIGILEQPALLGLVESDQLQIARPACVGRPHVVLRPPGRVAGNVEDALEGVRREAVSKEVPALVGLVRAHLVDRVHVGRVAELQLEGLLASSIAREFVPAPSRRSRHRALEEPELRGLDAFDSREHLVQRRRPRAREAHDDDRSLEGDRAGLGMLRQLSVRRRADR